MTIIGSVSGSVGIGLIIPLIDMASSGAVASGGEGVIGKFVSVLSFVGVTPTLFNLGAIIFACVIFQAFLDLVRIVLNAKYRDRVIKENRDRAFENCMRVSYEFYHHRKVGDLTSIIGDEALRGGIAVSVFNDLVANGILAVVFLSFLFFISAFGTLCAMGIAVATALAVMKLMRTGEALGRKEGEDKRRITTFCFEGMSNYFLIATFNSQEAMAKRFRDITAQVSYNLSRISIHGGLIAFINVVIKISSVVILFIILHIFLGLSLGRIAAVLAAIFYIMPRINQMNVFYHVFLENASGLRAVHELASPEGKPFQKSGTRRLGKLETGIEFRGVGFRYKAEGEPVLDGIDFFLLRGKSVALIGTSGSGKSTLVALLPRLYEPLTGEILVDGVPLRELEVREWRSRIGFISQETYIFNDSIKENLLIARPEATEEEVREALLTARLGDFLAELPEGLETNVGDRGLKLSGGQKQRIAIARAVLRNPEILILDEATSALDNISERQIQESIDELSRNRTVVMVAHRLSTVQNADEIIVLERGRIVEKGSPAELLKREGHYARYLEART